MRPPGGLLALFWALSSQAFAEGPRRPRPAPAPTKRVLRLGPDSTIEYTAQPGDERRAGTLSVLPMVPLPSAQPEPQTQEPQAQAPQAQESPAPEPQAQASPSVRPRPRPCGDLRGRLAVRLLQLRGLDVDEVSALWIWQRIALFGEVPLSALQSDLFARSLAVELAQCEADAVAR